jgi:hypothetical protein
MIRYLLRSVLPVSLALSIPIAALALEGIGPRVTVTGTVQEVRITPKQKFNEAGGELVIKATNGQIVNVVLQDTAEIVSEGRLSRKALLPLNIQANMMVRVRGWRIDSKSLSAALVIIQNIQLNPALTISGVLQAIGHDDITILAQDGVTRTYKVTNETTVNISYELSGRDALELVGKQVFLTLNPQDQTYVRILRITGDKPLLRY